MNEEREFGEAERLELHLLFRRRVKRQLLVERLFQRLNGNGWVEPTSVLLNVDPAEAVLFASDIAYSVQVFRQRRVAREVSVVARRATRSGLVNHIESTPSTTAKNSCRSWVSSE